jgi:hypothetical protein
MSKQVGELMTAILGPDGGGGSLEDTITLVLVKKVHFYSFSVPLPYPTYLKNACPISKSPVSGIVFLHCTTF